MTEKTWQLELEDGKHVVELNHGYFSGKRSIRVDGNAILDTAKPEHFLFDTGGVYEFNISAHPCAVIIRTNGITFSYDLAIDGHSVTTGESVDSIRPMPIWVWILIVGGFTLCLCGGLIIFLLPLIFAATIPGSH